AAAGQRAAVAGALAENLLTRRAEFDRRSPFLMGSCLGWAFTRCPGDRGNNPSWGFISPPLPSTSPLPLRSRHRPLTQRRSSPLFRDIFRDRLGHFSDAPVQPTPGSPHNAHIGP